MIEGIAFLDDATRPTAPDIPGVTPAQRAHGRRLAAYHRLHLHELAKVRDGLENLLAGTASVEEFTGRVSTMMMVENYRRFQTLCGNQCALLEMHHTIEDQRLFPALRQENGLRKVLDRLSAEHLTIHALIDRLVEMSKALSIEPSSGNEGMLREVYAALERVVVSHFGYEERELEEALGFFEIEI